MILDTNMFLCSERNSLGNEGSSIQIEVILKLKYKGNNDDKIQRRFAKARRKPMNYFFLLYLNLTSFVISD